MQFPDRFPESFRALPDVLRARVWARIDEVMAAPEWAAARAVLAATVKRSKGGECRDPMVCAYSARTTPEGGE